MGLPFQFSSGEGPKIEQPIRVAADIAKLPRIVTLNNIAINTPPGGNQLTLDALTKTFRYLDEAEVAKQKKSGAKQGAKK